jgi:hypothetical protein
MAKKRQAFKPRPPAVRRNDRALRTIRVPDDEREDFRSSSVHYLEDDVFATELYESDLRPMRGYREDY